MEKVTFDEEAFAASLYNQTAALHSLRSLAALFPDDNKYELPYKIREVIRESSIDFSEVMTLIRGRKLNSKTQLNDLRNVLRGIRVSNGTPMELAVPIHLVQAVGLYMSRGITVAGTAIATGRSREFVEAIDNICGFTKKRKAAVDVLVEKALDEGLSSRKLSRLAGISKSQAHAMLNAARCVRESKQAGQ